MKKVLYLTVIMIFTLVSVFGVIANAPADSVWNQDIEFDFILEHEVSGIGAVGRLTVDIMEFPSLLALYAPVSDIAGVEIFFSPERTNNEANPGKFVFAFLAPVGIQVPTAESFSFIPTPGGIGAMDILKYGDVDGDGHVTSFDSTAVFDFARGIVGSFSSRQLLAANVNGDGVITAFDATAIFNVARGVGEFPILSR